jgi:hypothetical protein
MLSVFASEVSGPAWNWRGMRRTGVGRGGSAAEGRPAAQAVGWQLGSTNEISRESPTVAVEGHALTGWRGC